MSEEISYHMPWEERVDKLVKVGTRVELNEGVAPAAQGQRGLVISHKWASIDQQVVNIVKMDDPDWGPKYSSGYVGKCETLGVGTHCCHLLGGAGEEVLFPSASIASQLRAKEKSKYG